MKKRTNSSHSLKLSFYKITCAARNWIIAVPQTAATTFAFSSVCILLLWPLAMNWLMNPHGIIGQQFSIIIYFLGFQINIIKKTEVKQREMQTCYREYDKVCTLCTVGWVDFVPFRILCISRLFAVPPGTIRGNSKKIWFRSKKMKIIFFKLEVRFHWKIWILMKKILLVLIWFSWKVLGAPFNGFLYFEPFYPSGYKKFIILSWLCWQIAPKAS